MSLKTTIASALTAAVLLAGATAASAQSDMRSGLISVSDGGFCGWYAISVCSRSPGAARRGAAQFGGRVINTDNVDNFRAGFFCAVQGPTDKRRARNRMIVMQDDGASSAYIKEGCEY